MDKKAIAEKLKKLRGDRSREEVAKALGISVSAISMYENADRVPRDDVKIRIANYFNTPINEIFF